ncbi:hypothetical protein HG535_0E05230 [Zygotorulaspora mrakii]|uniref:non-specific serine/threonine protein kinase n=1 Tax=Zygotorulaspora mrakii TaxID=42260 RepID=A0A7H9B630_ZYGMR|nr:uncharacterized protein HG535_0E05230 [Zygotorulaspora mrakii]QLG73439.1 hypothetical protein HG535_0E05230 [Zygotorulaspora mrakii]
MSSAHRTTVRRGSNPISRRASSSTFKFQECDGGDNNSTVGNSEAGSSSGEDSFCQTEMGDTLYFEPRKVYKRGNRSQVRSSLVRVYSENEKGNFDHATGTRLFDDMKHRPVPSLSKIGSSKNCGTSMRHPRRYSMNENKEVAKKRSAVDMQDEYIPEFDFADVVNKWQMEDDENTYGERKNSRDYLPRVQTRDTSVFPSKFMTDVLRNEDWNAFRGNNSESASPNSSYILDSSHAQVDPIPLPNRPGTIPLTDDMNGNIVGSLSDENANTSNNSNNNHNAQLTNPFRRYGSSKVTVTESFNSTSSGSTQFPDNSISVISELSMSAEEVNDLIEKLPRDFLFMPYSSRKKFIVEAVPNKDYKLIMSLIKKFLLRSSKSSSSIGKPSTNGPPNGPRSRHSSVASQYLSSFSPAYVSSVASMHSLRPDDKGMEILGHRLGKVIGFGAWGMIRECFDTQSGAVRAMKIVRFRNNIKVKKLVIREVNIWQELKNDNILRLLKWKMDEDYAMYCLSEKISDGTLYDLVISWGEYTNSKISLRDRCIATIRLSLQVIAALKYMHSKSIVHGDVKLENCLIDKSSNDIAWRVLVCDFGMGCHFGHPGSKSADEWKFLAMHSNEDIISTNRPEGTEFISHLDRQNTSISKRPSISKSQSNLNIHNNGSVSKRSTDSLKSARNRKSLALTTYGVSSVPRHYGPSLTSTRIGNSSTPSLQDTRITSFSFSKLSPTMDMTSPNKNKDKDNKNIGPDPNSHIGSLPYAAPELLEPSPPPLGPSADIWALGVMLFTMLTGKLPFKHEYEPRLRAMIAAGKYDKNFLAAVCFDASGRKKIKFQRTYDAIQGCLMVDMSKRWDLNTVQLALEDDLIRI